MGSRWTRVTSEAPSATVWTERGARLELPSGWSVEQDARGLHAVASGTVGRCPATTVEVRRLDGTIGADRSSTTGMGCKVRTVVRYEGRTRMVCQEHFESEPGPDDCARIAASLEPSSAAPAPRPEGPVTMEPSVEDGMAAEVFLGSSWVTSPIRIPVPLGASGDAFLVQTGTNATAPSCGCSGAQTTPRRGARCSWSTPWRWRSRATPSLPCW